MRGSERLKIENWLCRSHDDRAHLLGEIEGAVGEEEEAEPTGVGLQIQGAGGASVLRHEVQPGPECRVRQGGDGKEDEMEVLQGHGTRKGSGGFELLGGLEGLLKVVIDEWVAVGEDEKDEEDDAKGRGEGEELVDERTLMIQVHENQSDERGLYGGDDHAEDDVHAMGGQLDKGECDRDDGAN